MSDPIQPMDWDAFIIPFENGTDQEAGLKLELKSYDIRENSKGDKVPLQTGKKTDLEAKQDKDHDSAMAVTKTYYNDGALKQVELVIRSPYIRTALKSVIKKYPGINLMEDKITIIGPPKCLFHFRDELMAYGRQLHDRTAAEHLAFALNYMQRALADDISHYTNCTTKYSDSPGLDFDRLWMEYRPGDLIFVKSKGISWVGRLVCMRNVGIFWKHWDLELERITWDGSELEYFVDEVDISKYSGFKYFKDLDAFPLKYHPEHESVKQAMIKRGKKFRALCGVHQRFYRSVARWALDRKNEFDEDEDFHYESFHVRSRVMIDAESFCEARPNHSNIDSYSTSKIVQDAPDSISDEQLMICNHEVQGYSLTDKRWCVFKVDNLEEIDFDARAFDNLILPQEEKDTILALAKVYTDEKFEFEDFIKGKGKGMIILLHGEPGLGKTLTAESISDYTGRPLFSIRSGDLGIDASTLEKSLNEAFEMAAKWKAIILIDEADVFLEKRRPKDLQRNSLVSVFLRVLEYYEGIMFLTTNRVEEFDPAFKSRIHMTIKYRPLSQASRRTLWHNFITLSPNHDQSCLDEGLLEELASHELNGRQIRNMVRAAHAIAVSAKSLLNAKHLRATLKAMGESGEEMNEGNSRLVDDEPHLAGSSKRRRLE